MTVKGATSWSGTFVCKDATGALAAATVGPAGTLYLNGTSNAASVTISGGNPYKWTLTLPALTAGDRVDIYITATVGGVATAAIVASDSADTKYLSDTLTANMTQIDGAATNGNNATLKLKALDIQNVTGSAINILGGTAYGVDAAIKIKSNDVTGANNAAPAVRIVGGDGVNGYGGDGVEIEGGDTSGNGIAGYGLYSFGGNAGGSGDAGYGLAFTGGMSVSGYDGVGAYLSSNNNSGLEVISATGNAAEFWGGTSGDGIHIEATNGNGITAIGTGAGNYDVNADIHGTIDTVTTLTDVTDIDTELSGVHGAGAWGPSAASGAFTIHIRAQDSATLLYITDALISVKDNADTTLVDQQRTADDGTATRITTSLNAATYKLHCSVPGYTSVVVSHVVSGNEDITLSLAPIIVGSPSVPSQCRVYGFEYTGVGGLPVLGSAVSAVLTGPSQVSGNNILEVQAGSTTSDASGYWYLDLTIGKTYKITIPQADIEIEIVVPNLVSVNLKTLLI